MTRVNLVDVGMLSNEHLMAEYREIPRIFSAVSKLINAGKKAADIDIPEHYVLGKGHVKFFYNKINFLQERHLDLFDELKYRGYNIDKDLFRKIHRDADKIPNTWRMYYEPKHDEIYLNMARLVKRSNMKPVYIELLSER